MGVLETDVWVQILIMLLTKRPLANYLTMSYFSFSICTNKDDHGNKAIVRQCLHIVNTETMLVTVLYI